MKKTNEFSAFWNKQSTALHHHDSENWLDKYYQEFLFHAGLLAGSHARDQAGVHALSPESIVDTGCGAGDLLIRMGKNFKLVYGIDYSKSLIEITRNRLKELSNVQVFYGNMLDVGQYVKQPVDIIFNNEVLQYLNKEEVDQFIESSVPLLTDKGFILLFNIPNQNCRNLYNSGFFHKWGDEKIGGLTLVSKLVWRELKNMGGGLLQALKLKEDNFGHWHTVNDLRSSASRNGLSSEFFYSMYPPFGYRFHAKLKKEDPLSQRAKYVD